MLPNAPRLSSYLVPLTPRTVVSVTLGTLSSPVPHASSVVSEPTRNCGAWGKTALEGNGAQQRSSRPAKNGQQQVRWEGSKVGAGCPAQ